MELALLLRTRAGVALTQDVELGPVLERLLRETALRRHLSGLLVLRVGRRRANLTPLECLVEGFELRKNVVALCGTCGVHRAFPRTTPEWKDGQTKRGRVLCARAS